MRRLGAATYAAGSASGVRSALPDRGELPVLTAGLPVLGSTFALPADLVRAGRVPIVLNRVVLMSTFFPFGKFSRLIRSRLWLAAAVTVGATLIALAVVPGPGEAAPPALSGQARV